MKNKKAFTLIEVMITLAIFSVVAVLLSAILIQGQRILSKVNNRSVIQDEIRISLLKIQSEAQNSGEITVNNKFGKFYADKWLLDNTDNTARELVRFSKDGEDTAKVYVEVNNGNKHQLIEFSINKTTNIIVENSTNVLINEINGNDANTIIINVEDINDLKGNKINELITINCSNIVKGQDINESDYLVSFENENENIINIDIGSDSNVEEGSDNEEGNLFTVQFKSTPIETWEGYSNYEISITNNTSKNIQNWELNFKADDEIISCWQGILSSQGNGTYKITSYEWNGFIANGQEIKIYGQCKNNIINLENMVVNFNYKE